jgi:GAF domain-containing protein
MDRIEVENRVIAHLKDNLDSSISDLLDITAAALKENFSHYTGVYIYLLEGVTLVLGPYRGRPTEHTRIPIGAGICGRAARVKETVKVDDVNADAEYIACSLETKSEIVVPIMRGERVFGEIDIDSDVPAAFSTEDQKFLEQIAALLAPKFADH